MFNYFNGFSHRAQAKEAFQQWQTETQHKDEGNNSSTHQ